MDTFLVAIASPHIPKLTDPHAELIGKAVGIAGKTDWLSPGEAFQIGFQAPAGFDADTTEKRVRTELAGLPIDIAFVPAENRKKKLLVADMDSTMIEQECIDELAAVAGIGDQVVEITAKAMAGELDFQQALRARLTLLKGLPESAIDEVIKNRISFTPGGRELVQTMKKNGALTALVSGGFTHFTSHVAKICDFDEHQANVLEIRDGKLTGKALEPIMDKDQKKRSLAQLTVMNGMTFADTMAVGDGANDLPMLQRASFGVALHGKKIVREGARFRIDYGDLTALLYLQGYYKSEFSGTKSQTRIEVTTSN